jgi:hypothetical protein
MSLMHGSNILIVSSQVKASIFGGVVVSMVKGR